MQVTENRRLIFSGPSVWQRGEDVHFKDNAKGKIYVSSIYYMASNALNAI